MTATSSFFRRDGLSLHISSLGEGRPFLFQHGLCGAAPQPQEVFPLGQGWRCLTMECRGHGRSEAGDASAFSIATFADDLADFIGQSGLAPLPVGGISMGAAIALRLAVRRPDLVSGLVLARPAWLDEAAPPNLAPNALVGDLLCRLPGDNAEAAFLSSTEAARLQQDAPDNLRSLLGFFRREPTRVTAELLCRISACGTGVAHSEIAAIRVPTLIIGHEHDAIHPMAMARALAGLIDHGRLVEITPKSVDLQRYRDDFTTALAGFLKGLEHDAQG